MSGADVEPEARPDDVVINRLVARALADRGASYQNEVRRLMDACLAVMLRGDASTAPRVADIVAEAKVSNETFYRYFPSKGALMAAVLEAGTARLRSYLEHQMAKERDPERKIRRWVDGLFSQTRQDHASVARAVTVNASMAGNGTPAWRHSAATTLATLLQEPFAELGNPDPELASLLAGHGAMGQLSDHIDAGTSPTDQQRERIALFCLAVARAWPPGSAIPSPAGG